MAEFFYYKINSKNAHVRYRCKSAESVQEKVAKEMAEDYWYCHEKNESEWPIDLHLWDSKHEYLGEFEVWLEIVLDFHVHKQAY